MANLQGYTSGAVGNMLNHYTRHDSDPQQSRYRYQNQRIDTARTHLNYALFERRDPRAFIRQRVAGVDTKPTKSTNVISDWVITLPKNERLEGREREFFEAAFEFLKDKVGEENVVGAWVHMDETSPHLHFCFVPVSEQTVMTNDKSQPLRWTARDEAKNPEHRAGEVKRDSKGTVRYKRVVATDEQGRPLTKRTIAQSKVFDREAMKDFHPQLSAHMKERFGFDVGVELEDEGDKVLSRLGHAEYVAAKATIKKTEEEVARIEDKREEMRRQAARESERLEELQRTREAAQRRVRALEAVAAECRASDDAPVSKKGGLLDRVAALCARCAEWLGVAIKSAKEGVQRRLTIDVRDDGAAQTGARNHRTAQVGGIVTMGVAHPQREIAYGL